MKRSTLCALFIITASVLTAPVFAADGVCEKNLAVIKNGIDTMTVNADANKQDLMDLQAKAQAAKDAGHEKDCIDLSGQAIKILQDNSKTKS